MPTVKRSVMVMTPNCGAVYIAVTNTGLECFWHGQISQHERLTAGHWLFNEGWFQYANGIIDLDMGLFDRIQEEAT